MPVQARLSVVISCTHSPISVYRSCFLSTVLLPEHPLPSTGSTWAAFPGFTGTIGYLRLLALRPESSGLPWIAVPLGAQINRSGISVSTPFVGWCLTSLTLSCRASGENEASQVPGVPSICVPRSLTPVGPPRQAITTDQRGLPFVEQRRLPR